MRPDIDVTKPGNVLGQLVQDEKNKREAVRRAWKLAYVFMGLSFLFGVILGSAMPFKSRYVISSRDTVLDTWTGKCEPAYLETRIIPPWTPPASDKIIPSSDLIPFDPAKAGAIPVDH